MRRDGVDPESPVHEASPANVGDETERMEVVGGRRQRREAARPRRGRRAVIVVLALALLLAVVAGGGWYLYRSIVDDARLRGRRHGQRPGPGPRRRHHQPDRRRARACGRGGRAGVVHRGRGRQRQDPVGAARVLRDAAAHVGRVGRRPDAGPEVAGGAAGDPRRCPARRHEGARRRRHPGRAQPHRAGHLHDGRRRREVRDGRPAAHRHVQDRPRAARRARLGARATSRRHRRTDGSRGC